MSDGYQRTTAVHDGLVDARQSDQLGVYLRQIWSRRAYAWYVAVSELRSRQINSVLGNLWHLINPMLQVGVFFLIFGVVLDITRGVDNFIGFLAVGIFVYSLTQKTVLAGGRSLTKYRGLIQIINFPRALIPLTTTLTETLAAVPAYLVMLVVATATGERPSVIWFLIVPMIFVQALFNLGLALATARAVGRVADIQQVLPFVFRLGFYASGVLFNVQAYAADKSYRWLFEANPLYCFIEINRSIVLADSHLDWRLVAIATGWTVTTPILGFLWFRAAEDTYGSQ